MNTEQEQEFAQDQEEMLQREQAEQPEQVQDFQPEQIQDLQPDIQPEAKDIEEIQEIDESPTVENASAQEENMNFSDRLAEIKAQASQNLQAIEESKSENQTQEQTQERGI